MSDRLDVCSSGKELSVRNCRWGWNVVLRIWSQMQTAKFSLGTADISTTLTLACRCHKWRQCHNFLDTEGSVSSEFIPQGQGVNQACCVEILKRLREAVRRKWPEHWPSDLILHLDSAPAHKALSVKQFLAQKSTTEMEHPPYSPDVAPNNFWLFPKIKSAFNGTNIEGYWRHHNKCDDGSESYFTTGVPKHISNNGSIVGQSA
jgi:hypothetical protein